MRMRCLHSAVGQCWHGVRDGRNLLLAATAAGHPVNIDSQSLVQLPAPYKCPDMRIEVPWRDIASVWKDYNQASLAEAVGRYVSVRNNVWSMEGTTCSRSDKEHVLSLYGAELRLHQLLWFQQDGHEHMVLGLRDSSLKHFEPVKMVRPRRHFKVYAWGCPGSSEVLVPPAQHVTIYTQTWLGKKLESIQMPWSAVKYRMVRVANDENIQDTFQYNDEDLSVLSHYVEEQDGEMSEEQLEEGKKLLCDWHAIGCRRYGTPFRVDILGRPHLLEFKASFVGVQVI